MSNRCNLDVRDLAGTTALGRRLGQRLFAGAVVALVGPLGAGKTHLVRAMAEGLGVAGHAVSSPTFVLIQEYRGRLPVYHFDAYRLDHPDQFADLGVQEYYQAGGVCLVEWADRVEPYLPAEHLRLTIDITGPTARHIELEGRGSRYAELVADLAANA